MRESRISVVVPVYNVENYLNECLESILQQTYHELEVILVDDGSTDRSGELCEEWKKKDKRIHVIHQSNQGLSEARNRGLEHITGKYVAFVDSDDILHPQMYEHLADALQAGQADVAICKETLFWGDKPQFKCGDRCEIRAVEDKIRLLTHMTDDWITTIDVVWNKLYKKELLEGICFPKGKLSEDVYFQIDVLLRASKAVWLDEKLYGYRQRTGSIMHQDGKIYTACAEALIYQRNRIYEQNIVQLMPIFDSYLLRKIAHMRLEASHQKMRESAKELKGIYQNLYHGVDKERFSVKDRINTYLARYMWWIYCIIHIMQ